MLNKILILCTTVFLFLATVKADELTVNPDHPEKYTVVKGDTLWDISKRFFTEPWRWPEIFEANPQIVNPHLIYPGDVISLTYQKGKPVLQVERVEVSQQAVAETGPVKLSEPELSRTKSTRNVKLSPMIRITESRNKIPTIPVDAIQQLLETPLVLNDSSIDEWPYVVSSYDQRLIAATGNKIYIRGISDQNTRSYSIYRKGSAYVNPNNKNDILGYEAIYVGDAKLEKLGDPASAIVTKVDREVLVGDRLLPKEEYDMGTEFMLKSPEGEVEGSIISVLDGVSQIGQYSIVALNVGESQGVQPGNVLGIYQQGEIVGDEIALKDTQKTKADRQIQREKSLAKAETDTAKAMARVSNVIEESIEFFDELFPLIANKQSRAANLKLPEEYVGVAMVFRTFDKVSYALVIESYGPVHVLDSVKNL